MNSELTFRESHLILSSTPRFPRHGGMSIYTYIHTPDDFDALIEQVLVVTDLYVGFPTLRPAAVCTIARIRTDNAE